MRNRWSVLRLALVLALAASVPALAQLPFVVSGNIASGAQYDLYTVTLSKGVLVTATLVCDEVTPGSGNRPLDPVLSVFFPGNLGTDDTINADLYNDDGFGSDDDPNGVDCNAFDSSRVIFSTPVGGDFTFRADGFGSSTGPYTLSISAGPSILEIPTLGPAGIAGFALLLMGASLFYLRKRRAA